MARNRGPVLVDTNVIIESHRVNSWRALTGGYRVETVEECVAETQAGASRRRPAQRIDETALRDSLSALHSVSNVQRAELTLRSRTSRWTSVKSRSGLTLEVGTTPGFCADRTARVSVAAFVSGSASELCH